MSNCRFEHGRAWGPLRPPRRYSRHPQTASGRSGGRGSSSTTSMCLCWEVRSFIIATQTQVPCQLVCFVAAWLGPRPSLLGMLPFPFLENNCHQPARQQPRAPPAGRGRCHTISTACQGNHSGSTEPAPTITSKLERGCPSRSTPTTQKPLELRVSSGTWPPRGTAALRSF